MTEQCGITMVEDVAYNAIGSIPIIEGEGSYTVVPVSDQCIITSTRQ